VIPDAIAKEINRIVAADQLHRAMAAPIDDEERESVFALVGWFTTRYPSGEARLAYVRAACRRWRNANSPTHAAPIEP